MNTRRNTKCIAVFTHFIGPTHKYWKPLFWLIQKKKKTCVISAISAKRSKYLNCVSFPVKYFVSAILNMTPSHLSQGSKSPSSNRGKLRLFSNRMCPYAQRIRLILDAKKMQYETVNINLANKPDWYFQICPGGKVPALELENGEILYESLIIADYIDEKYTQHTLYSKDPLQKAKDKLMLQKFDKIISTMYKIITPNSRRYMEDQHVGIMEGLQVFEEELVSRGTAFFGGRKPGMLDYLIWPWCERADVLKLFGSQFVLKKERFGKLLEWRVAMKEIKAVQKSYLEVEEHIKFLKSLQSGFPEYDSKL